MVDPWPSLIISETSGVSIGRKLSGRSKRDILALTRRLPPVRHQVRDLSVVAVAWPRYGRAWVQVPGTMPMSTVR